MILKLLLENKEKILGLKSNISMFDFTLKFNKSKQIFKNEEGFFKKCMNSPSNGQ